MIKEISDKLKLMGFSKEAQAERIGIDKTVLYNALYRESKGRISKKNQEAIYNRIKNEFAKELGTEVKEVKKDLEAENRRLKDLIIELLDKGGISELIKQEVRAIVPELKKLYGRTNNYEGTNKFAKAS